MRKSAAGLIIVLCLNTPTNAAMETLKNPADLIKNPVDRIYNPATRIANPAATIDNPATRIDSANPLTPPVPPAPQPAVTTKAKAAEQTQPTAVIPRKNYSFKTAQAYINAAKKAFIQDDYLEFLSITEDALRRIDAGTLKASMKSKQKLTRFKIFGYGLLEKSAN